MRNLYKYIYISKENWLTIYKHMYVRIINVPFFSFYLWVKSYRELNLVRALDEDTIVYSFFFSTWPDSCFTLHQRPWEPVFFLIFWKDVPNTYMYTFYSRIDVVCVEEWCVRLFLCVAAEVKEMWFECDTTSEVSIH